MDQERVLYEWAKNENEVVRATTTLWKNKRYYSVRLYFKGSDDEYHPTKRGITLGADQVADLVKAVKAIAEATKNAVGNKEPF